MSNPRLEELRKQVVADNHKEVQEKAQAQTDEPKEQVKEEVPPQVEEQKVEEKIEDKADNGSQVSDSNQQELTDETLFKTLSEKLGRNVSSFDELTKVEEKIVEKVIEKEKEIEDQEYLTYKKFKEETGRTFDDFMKVPKDWTQESEDVRVREYLRNKYKRLSEDKIDFMIKDKYKPDPEESSVEEITRAEIEYNILLGEADEFLEKQKAQYMVPKVEHKPNVQADYQKQQEQELLAWTSNVSDAVKRIDSFEIDGYKHDLSSVNADKYSTPDNLLKRFAGEDGNVDFAKMIKTIEIGESVLNGTFTRSFSDSIKNRILEEQHRELNNHTTQQEAKTTDKPHDKAATASEQYVMSQLNEMKRKKR